MQSWSLGAWMILFGACASSPTAPTAPAPTAPAQVDLLIVTAVDYEFDAARSILSAAADSVVDGRQVAEGTVGAHHVVVIRAGWGKAQAAGATASGLDHYHPAWVLMAGVAGGVDPSTATSADVVIATGTWQYDLGLLGADGVETWPPNDPMEKDLPVVLPADAEGAARLTAAVRAVPSVPWQLPEGCACSHKGVPEPGKCEGPPRLVGHEAQMACAGVMATGDAFLVNPKVGLRLASEHGSVTVDMESAAVALEARNHGTRFAALRVIGDTVGPLGESLYYCLKPMSGQRLADALRAGVPALLDGPTPPGDVATCRAPAATEAMTVEAVSAEKEAAPMGLRLR